MGYPMDINPSISTLIENAQRANPMYGKKTKDVKKKKLKSKASIRSGVDTDTMDLSDDMLGDMDPDSHKGKDNLAEFKKKMKQWIEEKKEDKEEEEEEQKEEETIIEDGLKEEAKEEKSIEKKINTQDTATASKEVQEILKEAKKEQEEEEKKEYRDPLAEEVSKDIPPKAEYPDIDIMDLIKTKQKESEETDKKEILEISKNDDETLSVLEGPSSEFVSLLSYDDGFIIAEPNPKKKKASETSAYGRKIRESHKKKKKKKAPVSITPPELRARFKDVFDKMIISENRGISYENLCQQLKIFGIRVLETCQMNKERILLIPMGKTLEDFKSHLLEEYNSKVMSIKYGYFPNEKLVVLSEEVVLNGNPRVQLPILYFAYAFDHALGQEGFASENSPAVLSNYNSCLDREEGHIFIDGFSSVSPVHYFAQAVEAFLTAPHGQLSASIPDNRDPICRKDELYDIDRSIYSYIEYLFKQVNRGDELKSEEDQEVDFGKV